MPAVFVHGVPETPALWDGLISHLNRTDVVTPQLPGFGCQTPSGFTSTKEEYVEWLISELETLGSDGPVDLVGHDWGGGFTVRVVSTRPDLVRSWVSDAAGLGDEKFEWHQFAKMWQTPEVGEQFFAAQLATPADARGGAFEGFGVAPDEAKRMGGWLDQTMADSILALYRSAVDVGREWAPEFIDIPAPGMVLLPSEDAFLNADLARAGAKRAGAEVAELPGVGHWWMLQDPARGAAIIEEFWAGLS